MWDSVCQPFNSVLFRFKFYPANESEKGPELLTLPEQTSYFISQCQYCDVARSPIYPDSKERLCTITSYILETNA